jgi:hypothetical protein
MYSAALEKLICASEHYPNARFSMTSTRVRSATAQAPVIPLP